MSINEQMLVNKKNKLMKHNKEIIQAKILETLEYTDTDALQDKIQALEYDKVITADQIIYAIMFLWEDDGYVIKKKTEKI